MLLSRHFKLITDKNDAPGLLEKFAFRYFYTQSLQGKVLNFLCFTWCRFLSV